MSQCLSRARPAFLAMAAWLAFSLAAQAQSYRSVEHLPTGDPRIRIEVLSSRSELVSGGDALVAVVLPAPGEPQVRLNGRPLTTPFEADADRSGRRVGLVTGLHLGDNLLEVRQGRASARLTLTNWPVQGPVISGPHEQPFICMTDSFELPVTGGVLGPALNDDCEAPGRVDYVYRSTSGEMRPLPNTLARPTDLAIVTDAAGVSRPFMVRIETGVVNRSIYQLAMLHDPATPTPAPTHRSGAWNRGLIFTFGGGCPGGMYIQGKSTGGVLDPEMLARGYAVASSSLNVYGNNCHDLLAAETMMMVKERFIERFGAPDSTIGWGCSGGSYQALQIGDNYPGLLDGVIVGCSFPDVGHAAVSVHSFGARLVYDYFTKRAGVGWTKEEIVEVSGAPDFVSLETQGSRSDRIDPRGVCNAAIPKELLYDPETNPKGARCSIYDHGITGFGRDPATGFARRPLDNVGVQYGLEALNSGRISKSQFLDLNRRIGGVDIDARRTDERTQGDMEAITRAYRTGRFLSGGGGLADLPIIDYRAYADFLKGDPHQRFHSLSLRERLLRANGRDSNLVMLTESARFGLFSLRSPVLANALDEMGAWIAAIRADETGRPASVKVAANKPSSLVDACFTESGDKLAEAQVWARDTACNRLYPPHANPYIRAGAPIANNIVKCALKPVAIGDYAVAFTEEEIAELAAIFPEGVCDYARPGQGQQPLAGTWLSFGPAGGAPL